MSRARNLAERIHETSPTVATTTAPRPGTIRIPKRAILHRSKWDSIRWYSDDGLVPAFTLHLAISRGTGPSLWLRVHRLEIALHRYT